MLQAKENLPSAISQVTLDLLAVLELLLRDLPDRYATILPMPLLTGSPDTRAVVSYVVDQLGVIKSLKGWNGGMCDLARCRLTLVQPL